MKAFLLAAGLGTRLRPLTDHTPKCLVPIGDRPLLDIWLDALECAGVDEVLVNLHHLPEAVTQHLASRIAPPVVHTVFERELLGSAGTLLANRQWIANDEAFLACYADNLTDFDLRILIDAHAAHDDVATLTVFRSPNPWTGGVVELDASSRVVGFVEKPSHPVSDLTNAGMYAFDAAVMDEIDRLRPCDIGYDVLPRLVGRSRAVTVDGYFRDIGTSDAYQRAREEWPARALT